MSAPFEAWRSLLSRAPRAWVSVPSGQFLVQKRRREILTFEPGNRSQSVVQVKRGEARPIAQRLELLAVQLVGEVDDALLAVVEFEPYLVVVQIARLDHVSWCVLITGQ